MLELLKGVLWTKMAEGKFAIILVRGLQGGEQSIKDTPNMLNI